MANKPIKMQRIRQVLLFTQQGYSKRKVAQMTGVHRSVINRYVTKCDCAELSYDELLSLSDQALSAFLFEEHFENSDSRRQAEFESFYPYIEKELTRLGVTKQLLHRVYLEKHPDGYRYSQFCELILRRSKAPSVSMVMPCIPGEIIQVDFAGSKLSWCDPESGQMHEGEVLIVTFPFSGMDFVKVLRSQKQEDFIAGLRSALEYFNGTPQCLRLDNLKSGVIKANRYEPTFNALLVEFCNHYQMGLDATRVAKPKDKPHVERHVTLAYQRIYAPLRDKQFYSLEELNAAILPLLEEHHKQIFRHHKKGRRDLFETEEKPQLKPLPDSPFKSKLRKKAKVQKNYHVVLSNADETTHYYSVPYQYVGKEVQIIFDTESVEVYCNYERIAIHQRNYSRTRYTTIAYHMPEKHQHVKNGMDPDFLFTKAAQLGTHTEQFIRKLLDRGQFYTTNFKSCQGVLNLVREYDASRIDAACERALYYNCINYKTILEILKKRLDNTPPIPFTETQIITTNPNVRGSTSYQ
jgi:transposase